MLPFWVSPEIADQREIFLRELLMALAEDGRIQSIPPTTALSYSGRSGDVREFAAECRADFVVEGTLRKRNEDIEVGIWFVNGQSGRTMSVKRIAARESEDLVGPATAWLLADSFDKE